MCLDPWRDNRRPVPSQSARAPWRRPAHGGKSEPPAHKVSACNAWSKVCHPVRPTRFMKRHQLIKWSLAAGKLAVLALLIWFVRATLIKAFEDLEHRKFHVAWPWLIVSGAFYALATLPAGVYWYRLLRATDQKLTPYAAVRAFFVSQSGKYVPGKAMVLVLRAAMVRPMLVPATLVSITVILETLTNMAVGALMALSSWRRNSRRTGS